MYDVIIVGGGPAGLSAAQVLGRCRRKVLLCDAGEPRNAPALAMHCFLTRDGADPHELLRIGRAEIARYDVEFLRATVSAVCALPIDQRPEPGAAFGVTLDGGRIAHSRKLLLATGVRDVLPAVPGATNYFGRGLHHCPYCDAWEYRDQRLVALGDGTAGAGLSLALRNWSGQITACTNGIELDAEYRQRLKRNGIELREERIARLEGDKDKLTHIAFESGEPIDCDAAFFNTDQLQQSSLSTMLGCEFTSHGQVKTEDRQRCNVPGLFLAGDVDGDVQFVIVAAAEGATAAVTINRELQDEDCDQSCHRALAAGGPKRRSNSAATV